MARRRQIERLNGIARIWAETGPTSRFLIGTLIVAAIGLVGLTPKTLFNTELVWPYATFVAAVGWGRSGLGLRPMAVLILFGFAQDVSAYAPLGCFGFINLATFGASSAIARAFDRDRNPLISTIAPVVLYAVAFLLVWLFASFSGNHLVQLAPLVNVFVVTYILHILIAPVFDLGRMVGPLTGKLT
ncbi:MAG: hypothetical protein CME84_10980 [Henriciella sp.]|jgi:hypothetical protein|uniref:hypothetical protein n=1 Tax=Henriciella sp. TaxID=1968823 RepID=UPI000C0F3CCB|nr:hypothetical protein [Henriciella sp.]MAN74597.1 hypothetical protein [Henriciella sp.]MBF32709.1 hypothetical protein [Hyphomonadaceae bacterium]PHR76959.1 MAG: hypothetical protein COA64_09965 [Henriciella sp.]|tara:strand:+ start:61922 stop:62482 length:561 start_codon:yes stop_codon:yes gene_type:complete